MDFILKSSHTESRKDYKSNFASTFLLKMFAATASKAVIQTAVRAAKETVTKQPEVRAVTPRKPSVKSKKIIWGFFIISFSITEQQEFVHSLYK